MKVLVHDGIGFWLAARRLHLGHFVWPAPDAPAQVNLSRPQLDALGLGLPWSRIGEGGIITVVCGFVQVEMGYRSVANDR
jgi:transposase